jgi:hypothetical protein
MYIEVGRRFYTVKFCTIKMVSVGVGRVQSALLHRAGESDRAPG